MPAKPLHRAAHLLRVALVCALLLGLCPPGSPPVRADRLVGPGATATDIIEPTATATPTEASTGTGTP